MPNRKLPADNIVIEMYRSGMSSGEIAEALSVRPVTIISFLKRKEEPRRSTQDATRLRDEKGRGKFGSAWLGKKQPKEMVENRVSKIRGEKHYLWKGGRSRRPYRKVIDKKFCDLCGVGDNLVIHHRDLDHYNNLPANLQPLCVSCHASIHKCAYRKAIHTGQAPPKSNGPVGWDR